MSRERNPEIKEIEQLHYSGETFIDPEEFIMFVHQDTLTPAEFRKMSDDIATFVERGAAAFTLDRDPIETFLDLAADLQALWSAPDPLEVCQRHGAKRVTKYSCLGHIFDSYPSADRYYRAQKLRQLFDSIEWENLDPTDVGQTLLNNPEFRKFADLGGL